MFTLKHAFVIAALTASVAIIPAAQARIRGPILTSTDAACWALQNEADRLRAEYRNTSAYSERRAEILQRLRNIGSDWRATGCEAAHGSIIHRTAAQSTGVTGGENGGVSRPLNVDRTATFNANRATRAPN